MFGRKIVSSDGIGPMLFSKVLNEFKSQDDDNQHANIDLTATGIPSFCISKSGKVFFRQ